MIFARKWSELFRRQGEDFARILDHAAHIADAFGALGLTVVGREDVARAVRPSLNGRLDLAFANAIAVTDVQGARSDGLRMTLHIRRRLTIASGSQAQVWSQTVRPMPRQRQEGPPC